MKLIPINFKTLSKVLAKLNYYPVRQKGSHVIFENNFTRKITVVPRHNCDIGVGLLSMILREIGVPREEYFKILKEI